MDNLVHDSVYVIVLFADLDVIFKANLFHLNEQMTRYSLKRDNPHQSLRFILFCPGDRHSDVESSLILQKGERVALGMVGGCSMLNMFFSRCLLVSCRCRLSCPDNCLQRELS